MLRKLDPNQKYPMVMPDGTAVKTVVHLNQVIDHPRMDIGDFSYSGHLVELEDYASYIAPFLFPFSLEKLTIGKFCQIAHGVRFITSSANHDMNGFSTYPFANFLMQSDDDVAVAIQNLQVENQTKNTVIGHDVWIGMNATIMPGVTIGNGAIIGAGSIVTRDVNPYEIVGGNPAVAIKNRFDNDIIDALQKIQWWDWPVDIIQQNQNIITDNNMECLLDAYHGKVL